ncbi:hypothetical protein PVL29_001288 [Vitis rotundifolia]|uniref:Uncharacterized protein n=1 Tax=Vitis rotundifolia TaxID=103349 RepID=A0AA39ALH7_VITRO|nr:hypothetical protein PVL29_001288 [Vitis rotundifolia]
MVYTKKQYNERIDYESRSIELSFPKKNMKKILSSYLPYVVERSEAFKEENKVLKLYSYCKSWESTNLNHPSTSATPAMDSKLKQDLINDLDRFVKRKKYNKRSSAVSVATQEFRRLLVTTRNQSILVIEDIDCSSELQGQQAEEHNLNDSQCIIWRKNIIISRHTSFFPFINCFFLLLTVDPTTIAEELMKSEEADTQNEATNGEDKEANKKGNGSPVIVPR